MRVRWVRVLRLWWSLVFGGGRSGACVLALVASSAILLMLARWERTHAPTRIHTRIPAQ